MYKKQTPIIYTCNAQNIMKLLGKKWSLELLKKFSVDNKKITFTELKKDLRISQKVLDERLKELETNKLIQKDTTYSLTPLGLKLNVLLKEIESLQ